MRVYQFRHFGKKLGENIEAFAPLCNAKSRLTAECLWMQCSLALQLTRTNTMRPDRLAASFDPGLDDIVDSNKWLDMR